MRRGSRQSPRPTAQYSLPRASNRDAPMSFCPSQKARPAASPPTTPHRSEPILETILIGAVYLGDGAGEATVLGTGSGAWSLPWYTCTCAVLVSIGSTASLTLGSTLCATGVAETMVAKIAVAARRIFVSESIVADGWWGWRMWGILIKRIERGRSNLL
jgi:hypothetical protein